MRRIRADKAARMGSVVVLSAQYKGDMIARLGLDPIPKDCFISVPISEVEALGQLELRLCQQRFALREIGQAG